MLHSLRNPKFYFMLAADAVLFTAAFVGAYFLRFDFSYNAVHFEQYLKLLKYVLSIKMAVFFGMGLYRGMWRYTSVSDAWKILEATVVQSVFVVAVIVFKFGFIGYSRGVFIVDWLLTFLFASGLRLGIRYIYTLRSPGGRLPAPATPPRRVLVLGAGRAGEQVLREVRENPGLNYEVVGLIDDDRGKHGRTIHGTPVLGGAADLASLVEDRAVDEVLIAVEEATAEQMRRVAAACKEAGVPHKILPRMGEIIHGRTGLAALREIDYQDLLGRSPVKLDTGHIEEYLAGKTVLVTGCGGSIGSELVRQIVRFAPAKLVLVDASEYNLYQIQMELRHELGFPAHVPVLGSVQDAALMDRTFAEHRPHCVFHAAAYKHVPLLELNPWQAVTNNVQGSLTVMEAAVRHGVRRFVVVSTDKAVRPANVMGASKRVTEILMRRFAGGGTRFLAVRFGNVVGSSGSVVPLFLRQIRMGGPVTVTHPEVTRFFMSISEAAQLILQAGALGKGGEIFVLDMGAPVKIADMAADLIRLSGKEPGKDVEIAFTGLREGEKLYEELITHGEGVVRTEHEKIMVLSDKVDECRFTDACLRTLESRMEELLAAAAAQDGAAIRRILKDVVPEYAPDPAAPRAADR